MARVLSLLFLLVVLPLAASSSDNALRQAERLSNSSSKTELFRAYNEYKNLYLQSIVNGDPRLRHEALKGIVRSGNKLHIDISKYESELASANVTQTIDKNVVKLKNTSETQENRSVTLSTLRHLSGVRWQNGFLVLDFDKAPDKDDVHYFRLYDEKKKRYRYVFDIADAILDKRQSLRHNDIKKITLAQFDPKTLRLVIENDSELSPAYEIKGGELSIVLGVASVTAPLAGKPVAYGKGKRVILDPGHGGKDGGAVGHRRYTEKKIVLKIAQKLRNVLNDYGYIVYMTRTSDKFISLQKRTRYANAKEGDLFISIHANAVPKVNAKKAYGIETYFLSNDVDAGSERAKRVAKMENSKDLEDVNFYGQQDFINILNREKIKKSERLAHDLQRNVLAKLSKHYKKVKDGGVREGPFWILVGAQMPAVLVEVGFITHPQESELLANPIYQQRFAEGMAAGIERYFANNP